MLCNSQHLRFLGLVLFSVLLYAVSAGYAFAAPWNCTSNFQASALNATNSGLITAIMSNITGLLEGTGKKLYEGIINDPNRYYQNALNAAILLVIVTYGVMITFDLANLRPGEVLSRLFKIGLIIWIASPAGGWDFFRETFARFFYQTMMDLIRMFLEGSAGIIQGSSTSAVPLDSAAMAAQIAEPLGILGYPMSLLFSAKFGITILGLLICGMYGFVMSLLLIWAGFSLLMAIFQAMFVYIKCIVGLWFLFALAPIFFIFLLFQRTSKLFEGWLNMVVNFTLQPVLLFAFISFFIVMVTTSLVNIFRVDWCFRPFWAHLFGIPIPFMWWRPVMIGQQPIPNGGAVDWLIYGLVLDPRIQFPIEMIDLLFFLMSSYLMLQYAKFVPELSNQLSQGGLTMGASMDDMRNFFSTRGWTPEQIGAKAVGKATGIAR